MKRFIVLLVGIIFLAVGVFMFVRNNNLTKNCTAEAEATVVDMKQEFSTDADSTNPYMYYPIIEYTAGSETVRVTMDSGSTSPAYSIDQKLTVMYNPNNVKEYYVKGEKGSSIMSIVFMVLGVAISGYGVWVALPHKKEGANANAG